MAKMTVSDMIRSLDSGFKWSAWILSQTSRAATSLFRSSTLSSIMILPVGVR